VSQITHTGTTCAQFRDGTAGTLSILNYSVQGGTIHQVNPGVFFYWVAVTAPAGNNSFTITQTITTGNFTGKFDVASGSSVWTSTCVKASNVMITQNTMTGAVTAQWTALTAGTYIIGIKYSANSVVGDPAPSPGTTVHYNFATTGVAGSTQGLDLVLTTIMTPTTTETFTPPFLACPDGLYLGGKTTGGSTPGDISIAFDQFPAPNDNSYGTHAIGWGTKGHSFKDLTNSDKAGFQILRPNNTVAVSFNVDYLTVSALVPSGYKSLGPFGGDGSIVTNSSPPLTSDGTTIQWDTSLARNLNGPQSPFGTYSSLTYFMGGVQTIGTTGTKSANLLTNSPPVDCSLAPDPSTCITIYGTPNGSQYLTVPNPWSASYDNPEYAVVPVGSSEFENAIARHVDGWNFHNTYFVTFKQAYLTAIGFDFKNYAIAFYDSATNTYTCPSGKWCIAPNPTALNNSPAKDCPPLAPLAGQRQR